MSFSEQNFSPISSAQRKNSNGVIPPQQASVQQTVRYLPNEAFQLYRQRAKLTQNELAQFIGLKNRRMIQSWEVGERLPTPDRLRKLVEIYLQQGVFTAGQEQTEAEQFWNITKTFFDNTSKYLKSFPVFDHQWFASLLNNFVSATTETGISEKTATTNGSSPESTLSLSSSNLPTNIPAVMNRLLGRDDELTCLYGLIAPTTDDHEVGGTRLVTLTGPGGIGKTRLAVELAQRLLNAFAGNVIWIELAKISNPNLLLPVVAQAIGVKTALDDDDQKLLEKVKAQICMYANSPGLLLIFDNFEHILPSVSLIGELLASNKMLKVIVTSREVLHLYGEQLYPVRPLPLPILPANDVTQNLLSTSETNGSYLESLRGNAAVQLFAERLRSVNLGFKLGNDNVELISRLCIALEGVPLALELAAAQSRIFSLSQLFMELTTAKIGVNTASSESAEVASGQLELLTQPRLIYPSSHQHSIRTTLGWSYDLLTSVEQYVFEQLAILIGSWTLDTALAILSNNPTEKGGVPRPGPDKSEISLTSRQITTVIQALVDKSLVSEELPPNSSSPIVSSNEVLDAKTIVYKSRNQVKFRMLEVIREFALEQLINRQGVAKLETLNCRHAIYCMDLADEAEAGLETNDQTAWLDYLEDFLPNIRKAVSWSLASCISGTFDTAKEQTIQENSNLLRIELGLGIINSLRLFWEVRCYWRESYEYALLLIEKTEELLKPSAQIAKEDAILDRLRYEYAKTKITLSYLVSQLGNYVQSEKLLIESLELAKNYYDDSILVTDCLMFLGHLRLFQQQLTGAQEFYQQALELLPTRKKIPSIYRAQNSTFIDGSTNIRANKHIAALKRSEAISLQGLANIAQMMGDYSLAKNYYERTLTLFEELDVKSRLGTVLNNMAGLAGIEKNVAQAKALYQRSLQLRIEQGNKRGIAIVYLNIGELDHYNLNYPEADFHFEQAIKIFRDIGFKSGLVSTLVKNAINKMLLNDFTQASFYLIEATKLGSNTFSPIEKYLVLSGLTILLGAEGHLGISGFVAGASRESSNVVETLFSTDWSEFYAQYIENLKDRLEKASLEKLFDYGLLSGSGQLMLNELSIELANRKDLFLNQKEAMAFVAEIVNKVINKIAYNKNLAGQPVD
jgi:predicted ATPase/transcriptional regulator with XRE-family HTH domain